MSKGPGTHQRLILSELAVWDAFYFDHLLGRGYTKARYNALLRAVVKLEKAGKIGVLHFAFGNRKTVIHRAEISFTKEDRRALRRALDRGRA
jgi:hypothetical protein